MDEKVSRRVYETRSLSPLSGILNGVLPHRKIKKVVFFYFLLIHVTANFQDISEQMRR